MFDKKNFATLINTAIGERSLNEYARQTGVSAAHISRLSRALLDTPPNPQTIKKLAEFAHNNISYNVLMNAAGYFDQSGDRNEALKKTPDFEIVATCRTDNSLDDDLPEEAKKEIEEFKRYITHKYKDWKKTRD
jgi:transcriptional regulator with XRE-family HTH domain